MNDPKRDVVRQMARELTEKLAAEGKLIEGGWAAFEYLAIPTSASEIQRTEMRKAFFAGAQHVFASILGILEPGLEATEKDFKKLDAIDAELKRFIKELESKK